MDESISKPIPYPATAYETTLWFGLVFPGGSGDNIRMHNLSSIYLYNWCQPAANGITHQSKTEATDKISAVHANQRTSRGPASSGEEQVSVLGWCGKAKERAIDGWADGAIHITSYRIASHRPPSMWSARISIWDTLAAGGAAAGTTDWMLLRVRSGAPLDYGVPVHLLLRLTGLAYQPAELER